MVKFILLYYVLAVVHVTKQGMLLYFNLYIEN